MPRVIITVPEKNPQPYRFKLDRKVVTLGRGSENDIPIDSGSVSGKHAEMHRVEGGYELVDLGSTNGIKHDGNRQQKISLNSGVSVKIGDVAFDFTLTEEELETLGREKPASPSPVIKEREMDEEDEQPIVRKKQKSSREQRDDRDPIPRRPLVVATPSSGSNFGMTVLFLVMAVAAFFVGVAIRHEKETGESLIKALGNKDAVEQVDPAPAPADAE